MTMSESSIVGIRPAKRAQGWHRKISLHLHYHQHVFACTRFLSLSLSLSLSYTSSPFPFRNVPLSFTGGILLASMAGGSGGSSCSKCAWRVSTGSSLSLSLYLPHRHTHFPLSPLPYLFFLILWPFSLPPSLFLLLFLFLSYRFSQYLFFFRVHAGNV